MALKNDYTLIRGRRMRVTRLDGCGRPVYDEESSAVTEGFISVGFTAQQTEAEEIVVTNANGSTCARDPGSPEFNGYELEITFCGVQPCILEMLTGQPPVTDALGDVVGFRMNSSVDITTRAFALEIWAGVPGVECGTGGEADQGSFGYILVPFVTPGVVGDFTIENAAINFVVSGASTKDGNGWGSGPYDVVPDAGGDCTVLPEPLDSDDHLYVVWTPCGPPDPTDGCVILTPPDPIAITGVVEGSPGEYVPPNATRPADLAAIKADPAIGDAVYSNAPWAVGSYVDLADTSSAGWNGQEWVAGPLTLATGVSEGAPGAFSPASATLPADLAALSAHPNVGDTEYSGAAWAAGNHVILGDASQAHWSGTAWATGPAPAAGGQGRRK